MEIQKYARDNTLWIEITDQKGLLMFGDLAKELGSSGKVNILCCNCKYQLSFELAKNNDGEKVWDWKHWRVFLKGNQISKGTNDYYARLKIEFYCSRCQGWLKPR